jgi:quercetin dioxygenase-like cupin family protein
MIGKFVPSSEAEREKLDWGVLGWLSRPAGTGAKQLVVIEVELMPGFGHNFHKHPDQEEVIYVIDGQVEQWLDKNSQVLTNGDSVFIGADVVHASFNMSDKPAKLLAILGPCMGEDGYELVEVFDQEPWKSLRG